MSVVVRSFFWGWTRLRRNDGGARASPLSYSYSALWSAPLSWRRWKTMLMVQWSFSTLHLYWQVLNPSQGSRQDHLRWSCPQLFSRAKSQILHKALVCITRCCDVHQRCGGGVAWHTRQAKVIGSAKSFTLQQLKVPFHTCTKPSFSDFRNDIKIGCEAQKAGVAEHAPGPKYWTKQYWSLWNVISSNKFTYVSSNHICLGYVYWLDISMTSIG